MYAHAELTQSNNVSTLSMLIVTYLIKYLGEFEFIFETIFFRMHLPIHFCCRVDSVDTSRLLIFTSHLALVRGVSLHVIGWRPVSLF